MEWKHTDSSGTVVRKEGHADSLEKCATVNRAFNCQILKQYFILFMNDPYIYIYILTNLISTSIHITGKKKKTKKKPARNKR